MAEVILAATTSNTASVQFVVPNHENYPTVSADNLAGSEEADIQISTNGSWVNTGVSLTATASAKQVEMVGVFRVNKDTTAGNCAISLHRKGYV